MAADEVNGSKVEEKTPNPSHSGTPVTEFVKIFIFFEATSKVMK
jgi:hypothetical protein